MTTTTDYLVRRLEPEDEPRVRDLLGAALAGGPTGERTSEFFRWKHRTSPFGSSPGLVACVDDRIVGLRLFLRWEFRAGGRTVRAVRPVDTATHPDHQGRGIFRRLTTQLVDELNGEADLIFNTPNANSLPGYLRMGWQSVGIMPVLIRPVDWSAFARGFRSAGHGQAPGDVAARCPLQAAALVFDDPRLPLLLGAAAAGPEETRLHTHRSLDFLRWRYAQAPGLDYRVITAESGSDLDGVAFGRLRRRGVLLEFTLADVITRPGDVSTARRLLRAARRSGCHHVATHLAPATAARSAARTTGFMRAPGTGMHLVARPLTPVRPDPLSPQSWRLALGDLEVF
ncbi:MAG TPA: GNAT family N-acetyltransferase [Jiangellaceae bacterium]|nr:GNAT family N-acetyltransferase [Jiangellaceae bacterium]